VCAVRSGATGSAAAHASEAFAGGCGWAGREAHKVPTGHGCAQAGSASCCDGHRFCAVPPGSVRLSRALHRTVQYCAAAQRRGETVPRAAGP
jgi:hypothetical protein